jgi:hypothetical protein
MGSLVKKFFQACIALTFLCAVAAGQVVVREIDAPSGSATGLCWDGEALWVSDYTTTIWRISPTDGAILNTLTGPTEGSDGLAWDNGDLWTISGDASDQTIYKIDTTNGDILAQISDPSGGYAGGLEWDGSGLWISSYYPLDIILEIDPATEETLQVFNAPGDKPLGLTHDGITLWNSSEDGDHVDRVYRLHPVTGQVLWSFTLPEHTPAPGRRPRGLAWDGDYLWLLAYEVDGWQMKVFQYDVSNADYPDIDFSVWSHDFGSHVVGFPVDWSTEATNIGNANLVIDSARFVVGMAYHLLEPAGFPVTLGEFESRSFVIEFDPPGAGLLPDTLAVYSNDPDENPAFVILTGTGLPDEGDIEVVPTPIDFDTVRIGSPILSTSRTAEIWNVGTGVLTVSSVEVEGEGFSMDAFVGPVDIDSSDYVTVRVWFAPTEARAYEGTLRILSDDPDESVLDVPLLGVGDNTPYEGGEILWHYQAQENYDNGINSIHWIRDVNGDGTADVLAASGNHLVYCLNGSSSGLADTFWTYDTGADPNHSGIVWYERGMSTCPDLTGDGVDEVLIGTSGGSRSVYALSGADGMELWMFDTHCWGGGGWVYEVYPISDINGDFIADVLGAAGDDGQGTGPQRAFALSGANGELLWEGPASVAFFSVRTIADVTGDGIPDVVAGNTDGLVVGLDGASGDQIWQATVGIYSPVFVLVAMGNANPQDNDTEDIAVGSAYQGVYCLDGGDGDRIWFAPVGPDVYEIGAGSDITGDDIPEIYAGTMALGADGRIICFDGASGGQVWSMVPDPVSPRNVLSMTIIPDINDDRTDDIVAGTLGNYIVLIDGWDGSRIWSTFGQIPHGAVDAVDVLPDIDGNGSWEILAGNRLGVVQALSGGLAYSSVPVRSGSPEVFALAPNYPNPFNLRTTIPYSLEQGGLVRLSIYDLLGRRVVTLVDGVQLSGQHEVVWNGVSETGVPVASGVYFAEMRAKQFTATRKIVLLK